MTPPLHIIFAGGGTGGHLFPMIAIAEALGCSAGSQRQAHFVTSRRRIDATVMDGRGFETLPIPAEPFGVRPRALWKFLSSWGSSVSAVRQLIRRCKTDGNGATVRMVASGGFIAAPAVQAARVEGIPLVNLNLDAVPGKANLLINRFAPAGSVTFTTFPVAAAYASHWRTIPPIVRREALASAAAPSPQAAKSALGLDPSAPVLMVTGGSQGAGSINGLLALLARTGALGSGRWQVLHQVGRAEAPHDAQTLAGVYSEAGIRHIICDFNRAMGLWWAAADLCICRAGAGSVAEAWASATPAVFLPYPHHKDQHQVQNALPLVSTGGAVLLPDLREPAITLGSQNDGSSPAARLLALLADPGLLPSMRAALAKLGPVNGAEIVAQEVLRER